MEIQERAAPRSTPGGKFDRLVAIGPGMAFADRTANIVARGTGLDTPFRTGIMGPSSTVLLKAIEICSWQVGKHVLPTPADTNAEE